MTATWNFDRELETLAVGFRETDTGREVHVVGFAGVPATWTEC